MEDVKIVTAVSSRGDTFGQATFHQADETVYIAVVVEHPQRHSHAGTVVTHKAAVARPLISEASGSSSRSAKTRATHKCVTQPGSNRSKTTL